MRCAAAAGSPRSSAGPLPCRPRIYYCHHQCPRPMRTPGFAPHGQTAHITQRPADDVPPHTNGPPIMTTMPTPGRPPQPAPSRSKWYYDPRLLMLVPGLMWAGNAIVARSVAAETSAVGLAFWRWTLATLVLFP